MKYSNVPGMLTSAFTDGPNSIPYPVDMDFVLPSLYPLKVSYISDDQVASHWNNKAPKLDKPLMNYM